MNARPLRNDTLYFCALFGLWACLLFFLNRNHRYTDSPLPSAGVEKTMNNASNRVTELRAKIEAERGKTGLRKADKAESLHAMGMAWADLFTISGEEAYRDSAVQALTQSCATEPARSALHRDLGRCLALAGNAQGALDQCSIALRCDPRDSRALADAGYYSYFNLNRGSAAAEFSARALAIDGATPLCHLVLAYIDLDGKKMETARDHFEKEAANCRKALTAGSSALDLERLRFSLINAHYRLMLLYSTAFRDEQKAQEQFNAYVGLETDPERKNEAIRAMKKIWGE